MTLPLATIAARFPLVARKRPPAKPLDARVTRLAGLAETAHRERDPDKASVVFNGAALVASDCGDSELARAWCHRHAGLYLSRARLNGHTARFALEPVVNLARLRIRAGDGDGAHHLLTDLYEAIVNGTSVNIDGLELYPRQLPTEPSERRQLVDWLRNVLLSDGTRALTLTGRWTDALTHVRQYDGIGPTLLDGRQAAVVTHLIQGDSAAAAALLDQTTIEHPWEQAVHNLLQRWHATTFGAIRTADDVDLDDLASVVPETPGLAVFRTRLCLTALDLANFAPFSADDLIKRLVIDAVREEDANAARDLLSHPAVGAEHYGTLGQLVKASGLGMGYLRSTARNHLSSALDVAEAVLLDLDVPGLVHGAVRVQPVDD